MAPKRKRNQVESSDEEEEEVVQKPTRSTRNTRTSTRPTRQTRKKVESEEEEEEEEGEEVEETKSNGSRKQPDRKKRRENEEWESHENSLLYLNHEKSNSGTKVAAFDMDHTLVAPKSGKVFAQGRNDWKWIFPEVPTRLKKLHEEGFKVVIFSNQGGIEKKKVNAKDVCGKILDLAEACDVPLCCLFATKDDKYRKPSSDLWNFFANNMCIDTPDKSESFFVGDFAGRVVNWDGQGAKKDKGCSDRKFARNVGIKFYTPEEFFLKQKPAEFTWCGIDPLTVPKEGERSNKKTYHSDSQEIVVCVGFPASGKSTFSMKYLVPKGYTRVNRDTLKTPAKCLQVAKAALDDGKSVVIDNTNGSVAKRAEWINLADKYGIPVRCFYFDTDEQLAKHLNEFREKITNGEQKHVPKVGYNMYKKDFAEPKKSEGFSEVITIKFIREHPDGEHEKAFEEFTERIS